MVLQGVGMLCGLCKEGVEDVNHLFCTCKSVWLVWVKVIQWWGLEVVLPDKQGGDFREHMLELIQDKSFFWIRNKVEGCVFSFVQWQNNPVECARELSRFKRSLKAFKKQKGRLIQPGSPGADCNAWGAA
ncbi:hypothetical protein SLEP1_g50732 [Rubroshorea leprosula]|uniref:Reverse transcriptase zinc-binding domain-containing protein n=1 Tax=Rubroshorea leprosula TaxID=152421 RepID=A0AAV5M3D1_9ROSI|nr:hypothetical protein SLEP1_g50732 [Rubroshorea leprosula]